jgi:hypothetical protein
MPDEREQDEGDETTGRQGEDHAEGQAGNDP